VNGKDENLLKTGEKGTILLLGQFENGIVQLNNL
jgi:hypothetical protein